MNGKVKVILLGLFLVSVAYGLMEFTGPLKDLSTRWTRSRLLYTINDGNDVTQVDTVSDLTAFIAGTTNRVTSINDGVGGVTLSTPQDTHIGASPTFADMTLSSPSLIYALSHDNFVGFVLNEHIDHTGVSISAGTGLTGGGDLTATRTLSLSHLSFEDLTDPGADRIVFWDDSESKSDWLSAGDSLAITTTTLDTIQDIRTSASPQFTELGIGAAAESGRKLKVADNDNSNIAVFQVASNTAATDPVFIFRRSQGTLSSLATVANADELGAIHWRGYDGTDWESAAKIQAVVDGTPGDDATDMPGKIEFWTTPDGTDVPVLAMTIKEDGDIGVGTATPNEALEVTGKIRASSAFNLNGTDGTTNSAAGTPATMTVSGGIVTAITKVTPAANGTYNIYNDGTSGNLTSITITNGIITGVTQAP